MSHVKFHLSGISALIVVQSCTVQRARGLTNARSSGRNQLKTEIPIECIDGTIAILNKQFYVVVKIVPRFSMLLKSRIRVLSGNSPQGAIWLFISSLNWAEMKRRILRRTVRILVSANSFINLFINRFLLSRIFFLLVDRQSVKCSQKWFKNRKEIICLAFVRSFTRNESRSRWCQFTSRYLFFCAGLWISPAA